MPRRACQGGTKTLQTKRQTLMLTQTLDVSSRVLYVVRVTMWCVSKRWKRLCMSQYNASHVARFGIIIFRESRKPSYINRQFFILVIDENVDK